MKPRAELTQRQERFVQYIRRGKCQTEAYRLAGYKDNRFNACRLAKFNENVRKRLGALMEQDARRTNLTRDDILRMILEDRIDAKASGQYATALKADELLGKELHRMFKDRIEQGAPGDFDNAQSLEEIVNSVSELVSPQAAQALAKAFGLELDPQALLEAESPSDSVN